MGLDYDRIKRRNEHGSFWTSYADLFLMLSTVFLMLYVVATLRSGSFGVEKNQEYQEIRKEAEDLREQIRVYNALRDEQISKSSPDEQKVYANLMDKLSLLKEEARDEKEQLRQKARENEQKEDALNQYQQIIRNIINTNVLAKSQIKRREDIIHTKESVIVRQSSEIEAKERKIHENSSKISNIEQELATKIERLKFQEKKAQISKAAAEKSIANLRQKSEMQIADLKSQNDKERSALTAKLDEAKNAYQGQIDELKTQSSKELTQARSAFEHDLKLHQLSAAEREAKEAEFRKKAEGQALELRNKLGALAAKEADTETRLNTTLAENGRALATVGNLQSQLDQTRAGFQGQMDTLKATADGKLKAERAAFEKSMNDMQLSNAQRAAKEAEFRKNAAGQARELQGKLAGIESQARDAERKLAAANEEGASLKQKNAEISEDLKHAKEMADAKKNLAHAIVQNFRKAGIPAAVDPHTGDVTLAFPDDYFDAGQASLKPGMENRLKTFIPAYTKSLFSDPKTADKIANVEIIGFASPTYKGKYVNPQSLKESDREAVDYNLRLSFSRAQSIFKYIFNRRILKYAHQEELLPLVKVVGRGYLPQNKSGDQIPEGLPEKEFCEKFNCKSAQKVVVKFNLKE